MAGVPSLGTQRWLATQPNVVGKADQSGAAEAVHGDVQTPQYAFNTLLPCFYVLAGSWVHSQGYFGEIFKSMIQSSGIPTQERSTANNVE
ncbi:hypothetical protein PMIN01_08271 [Paraphaeosphaeria minitans]|uniref:Uncharacterized protein n=1 Tax=Paraphaeosphaeria minitans TaxID=565426 RepID=A0A9P6KNS9_9PLEO|nr:hypothetical protein PMIN01_08271 [Paraphaeosphaeria minitans]